MRHAVLAATLAVAAVAVALPACSSASVRGTGDRSLSVNTPRSMTLQRGTTAALRVGIGRENFDGAVTVSIFQLPGGVASDHAALRAETTGATFLLTAGADADLVRNQAVGVTVADPSGRQVTQFFQLTVRE